MSTAILTWLLVIERFPETSDKALIILKWVTNNLKFLVGLLIIYMIAMFRRIVIDYRNKKMLRKQFKERMEKQK
jgi:hypothetical protein